MKPFRTNFYRKKLNSVKIEFVIVALTTLKSKIIVHRTLIKFYLLC
jgi:hypothetical protein